MAEPAVDRTRAGPGANVAEYTVSELSGAIKRALEDGFGHVRLRGEISGYRGPHASGHCYFALKDERAKIEAVIWKGSFQRLRIKPEEGMEVIAQGRVTTYPGSSKYQIVIDTLEPAGAGALMAMLEERKRRFAAEGLFAEDRKRPLPFLPRVVGIVTSPTGAVIRDMLHGFDERFPSHVVVWPVRVQGESSAAEVAAAIRGFNAMPPGGALPRPDVLIVARGGGSLEDLWGFNDEAVVRAAAESRIPLISAVGHETDWTLIDLVADARAPTPTKAAEWAVPRLRDLLDQQAELGGRLVRAIRNRLDKSASDLKAQARGLPRLQDLVALPRQRFDAAEKRLGRALSANTQAHAKRLARVSPRLRSGLLSDLVGRRRDQLANRALRQAQAMTRLVSRRRTVYERTALALRPQVLLRRVEMRRARLDGLGKLLASLSHHGVLARGFAVLRDADGRMVRRAGGLAGGQPLDIELSDGHVPATVDAAYRGGQAGPGAREPDGEPAARESAESPRSGGAPARRGQGSLFD